MKASLPFRLITRLRRIRIALSVRRKKSVRDAQAFTHHKNAALALVHARIEHFNTIYHFSFNTVRIKNQSTRWGSCSRKRNLNFNYRIALLPARLADYIVVHELCHLEEMNHSRAFWDLVAKSLPDYRAARSELRQQKLQLL